MRIRDLQNLFLLLFLFFFFFFGYSKKSFLLEKNLVKEKQHLPRNETWLGTTSARFLQPLSTSPLCHRHYYCCYSPLLLLLHPQKTKIRQNYPHPPVVYLSSNPNSIPSSSKNPKSFLSQDCCYLPQKTIAGGDPVELWTKMSGTCRDPPGQ